MATKILFKQGTSAPSGASFSGSNGEPLWDKTNKKFYITNGTNSPTLIGPIDQTASEDYNDEISNLQISQNDTTVGGEYNILGEPYDNITQYWLDLNSTNTHAVLQSNPKSFIDVMRLLRVPGGSRKVTLFLKNLPSDESFWETSKFPMFWFCNGDKECLSVGTYSNGGDVSFRIWVSGSVVFDSDEVLSNANIQNISDPDDIATQALTERFYDGFTYIYNRISNGQCAKLEIVPTEFTSSHCTIDIYITCPSGAVAVTPIQGSQNATAIATINGTTIYSPSVSGYATITGQQGVTVSTPGLGQQIAKATLDSYTAIGEISDSSSVEDMNITPVGLSNTTHVLCVKETSAFGSDAIASLSSGTLQWTVSGESRSYITSRIDVAPTGGDVTIVVSGLASACQSDHYLYVFNNTSTVLTVSPASPDNTWEDYPVRGIPVPTVLKPYYGVELSIAVRRYDPAAKLDTVVMTASEPLAGSQITITQ